MCLSDARVYLHTRIAQEGIWRMLLLSMSRGTPAFAITPFACRLYDKNIKASAFQVCRYIV